VVGRRRSWFVRLRQGVGGIFVGGTTKLITPKRGTREGGQTKPLLTIVPSRIRQKPVSLRVSISVGCPPTSQQIRLSAGVCEEAIQRRPRRPPMRAPCHKPPVFAEVALRIACILVGGSRLSRRFLVGGENGLRGPRSAPFDAVRCPSAGFEAGSSVVTLERAPPTPHPRAGGHLTNGPRSEHLGVELLDPWALSGPSGGNFRKQGSFLRNLLSALGWPVGSVSWLKVRFYWCNSSFSRALGRRPGHLVWATHGR
jgi:hypothetical protein